MSVLLGIPIYIWIWSIGTKLYPNSDTENKLVLYLFKVSVLFPLVYVVYGIYRMIAIGDVIMPLHLAAMFCSLYAMIFAAKSLKSSELNKRATISEYLGDFFLIWFFPIGVWILQPRIHKIIEKQNKNTTA
jgi:uncharacterized membrane protein YagU involved in acid resistance